MEKVSVIVITRNRAAELDKCIKSVKNQTYLNFEIIIVDGKSTDKTAEVASRNKVKLIQQKGSGMSNARNCGLANVSGEIVAFIDDDCIADQNWLKELVKWYSNDVAGVGGKPILVNRMLANDEVTPETFIVMRGLIDVSNKSIGKLLPSGWAAGNFEAGVNVLEVEHLIGCNMSFRRKLLRRVGFDENYIGNCIREDTDACIAIRRMGYKLIYNPEAIVWHNHSQTSRTNFGLVTYYDRLNGIYFVLKYDLLTSVSGVIKFFLAQVLCVFSGIYRSLVCKDLRYLLVVKGVVYGFSRAKTLLKNRDKYLNKI